MVALFRDNCSGFCHLQKIAALEVILVILSTYRFEVKCLGVGVVISDEHVYNMTCFSHCVRVPQRKCQGKLCQEKQRSSSSVPEN